MKIRRQLNKYQENKSGLYRLRKHFSQLYLKPFERARKHINSFEHILTSPKCFCHNSSLKALRETTVIRSEKILILFSKPLSTYWLWKSKTVLSKQLLRRYLKHTYWVLHCSINSNNQDGMVGKRHNKMNKSRPQSLQMS